MMPPFCIWVSGLILSAIFPYASSSAKHVTSLSYNDVINSHRIVLLNFYAEWCHFSRALEPTYDQLADKVEAVFKEPGLVLIGRVNSEANPEISTQLRITKFPTFKLYRHGVLARNEYREGRTVDALFSYITKQLADPITIVNPATEITPKLNLYVVGTFNDESTSLYHAFQKTAFILRDECQFFLVKNASDSPAKIEFIDKFKNLVVPFLDDADKLYKWAEIHCIPFLRELTFENAEQMADEGKPLMVLFRRPDDDKSLRDYNTALINELDDPNLQLNFLYADGIKFSHPLTHLRKDVNDLPVVAIDSFRHMYCLPDFGRINEKGYLRKFVERFMSGQLHRELHRPAIETLAAARVPDISPPVTDSVFVKLAPSRHRYTFKDEL